MTSTENVKKWKQEDHCRFSLLGELIVLKANQDVDIYIIFILG